MDDKPYCMLKILQELDNISTGKNCEDVQKEYIQLKRQCNGFARLFLMEKFQSYTVPRHCWLSAWNTYHHDGVVREVKSAKYENLDAYMPGYGAKWSKDSKIITLTSRHFTLHKIVEPGRSGAWLASGQVDGMPIEFVGKIKYELFKDEVIVSPTVPRSMASFFQTLLNVLEKA